MTLEILVLFFLGLCVGSFINVVIDRLPKGKSILTPRSYCDHCKHELFALDLIPVVSFVFLQRKCRYCHKKISWQYPIVELTTALLFIFSYTSIIQIIEVFNLLVITFHLFIVSNLITILFIDLKYRIIPDQILIILTLPVAIYLLFTSANIPNHLLSGIIFFLLFFVLVLITKGKGMGLGDVKFAFVMGFLLGFSKMIVAFYLSFLTGALLSLILIIWGKKTMKSTIPFGPFLAGSTIVTLYYGDYLWNIFRRIIGI